MTQLFATDTKSRWTGSREIVSASSLVCGWCGPTFDVIYFQPALFRHGGYGAAEGKRIRFCQCGAINVQSTYILNPRKTL